MLVRTGAILLIVYKKAEGNEFSYVPCDHPQVQDLTITQHGIDLNTDTRQRLHKMLKPSSKIMEHNKLCEKNTKNPQLHMYEAWNILVTSTRAL